MLAIVSVTTASLLSGLCRLVMGWVAVIAIALALLFEISDLHLLESTYKQTLRTDAPARQVPLVAPGNPWASVW